MRRTLVRHGSSGWCSYAGLLATQPVDVLDLKEVQSLLRIAGEKIDSAPNRGGYTMNGFVMAAEHLD